MMLALLLAASLTIEDYATMPQLSTPRLSPDGSRVVYVVSRADLERSVYDTDVWMVGAGGTGSRQLTRSESSDTNPRWSPDGRQVAFLSDRDGGTASIWLIDADGGESRRLTREPAPVREFAWSPDGKSIAFVRLDEQPADSERRAKERDDAAVVGERRHAHLHLLDLKSGSVRRLTGGPWSVLNQISWSPDGSTIAFDRAPGTGLDDLYRSDIFLVSVADGTTTPLVARPGLDRGPRFSPDGRWVAFTSTGRHDWLLDHHIHVVPSGGGVARNVSAAYDRTPEALMWGEDSRTIYFEGPWNTTTRLFRVGADGSGFAAVTGADGVAGDVDLRDGTIVYVRQSLVEPPEIVLERLPAASKERGRPAAPRVLTNHNAAYRDRTLGETRLITWKNPKDGMEIEGLLTFPPGYTGGTRVPLLTFVHGGPASRFDQGFLGYHGATYPPHVFAALGFAVLRPNPRGTGGYGSAFRSANRNDWALMPWADVEAGIDKLVADGIADPERLGLMGWSYGGYLASWVLGHSDRFRACSIGAPVTDLLSFHGTSDIRDFLPHYFDARETPDTSLDEMRHAPLALDLLRAQSPAWHLRKTAAKVLIQHGTNDERVPLSQGMLLYRLLDELGADVTMVTYPRSGHAIREPKLKMDVMRRNVELMEKYVRSPARTD